MTLIWRNPGQPCTTRALAQPGLNPHLRRNPGCYPPACRCRKFYFKRRGNKIYRRAMRPARKRQCYGIVTALSSRITRSRVHAFGDAVTSNALKRRVVSRGVVIPTEFGVGVVKYPPAVATLPAELRFSQTTTPCGVTPWTPLPHFMSKFAHGVNVRMARVGMAYTNEIQDRRVPMIEPEGSA